jgi:hypothetical protein
MVVGDSAKAAESPVPDGVLPSGLLLNAMMIKADTIKLWEKSCSAAMVQFSNFRQ